MLLLKKEIEDRLTILKNVKGLTKHNDIWNLQQLITNYSLLMTLIDTTESIDKNLVKNYIISLDEEYEYYDKQKYNRENVF